MILSYTNMRLLLVLIKQNYKETGIAKFNPQKYRGFNMQKNEALQQEEGKVKYSRYIKTILYPYQHHVYSLLAIVLLFLLCNILRPILMVWDMINFNMACQNLNTVYQINFHNFGYSTANIIVREIGKINIQI